MEIIIVTVSLLLGFANSEVDKHGGVKMGVSNPVCDDAHWKLEVDWDNSTNNDYTCLVSDNIIPRSKGEPVTECIPEDQIPWPLHKCMTEKIIYDDPPPRAGPHRPLWPVYGEYLYIPPQRWVHALEHGAAVFLYHPCADIGHITRLKILARSCLRRHIITPYKNLPKNRPFAVVTYGCRLLMSEVDEQAVINYVKVHAIKDGPEKVSRDGQYDMALIKKSEIVTGSDMDDANLCPHQAGDVSSWLNTLKDLEEISRYVMK